MNPRKLLLGLFFVELSFLLYSVWRGKEALFVKIAAVLIPVSLIACLMVYKLKADIYLAIWTILLLNLGFLIQIVSEDDMTKSMERDMIILLLAFVAAFITAVIFRFSSRILSLDIMLPFLIAVQMVIIAALHLFGGTVGEQEQAAKILLKLPGGFSFQPLELVKVLFCFIMATILCKNEFKNRKILMMPREVVAAIYTLITALSILSLGEGGTTLVLLLVAAVMILVFGDKRLLVKSFVKLGVAAAGILLAVSILLRDKVPFLDKLCQRIFYFLEPDSSYQALQARKALAMGGLFGPVTNRYIVYVPRQEEDMIFSKLVGCTGVVVGIIALGAILLMFREGYVIASKCKDSYYKGLTMGFSLVIVMEAVIHIAYNLSLFPITGIPLYFVSHGFSSMICGMIMVGCMLVISRGAQERGVYNERILYERIKRIF